MQTEVRDEAHGLVRVLELESSGAIPEWNAGARTGAAGVSPAVTAGDAIVKVNGVAATVEGIANARQALPGVRMHLRSEECIFSVEF